MTVPRKNQPLNKPTTLTTQVFQETHRHITKINLRYRRGLNHINAANRYVIPLIG